MNLITLNTVSLAGNVIVKKGGGSATPPSGDSTTTQRWTGHADVEGLKAIGWTDEDIAYYQENGVNWNKEDDEYHKVSDDNKALYGVLTADNISTYKDRIVYLPKIDTSGIKNMNGIFMDCKSLISIPLLDTSSATNVANAFKNCHSLVCIPPLDFSSAGAAGNLFYCCYSLTHIPDLDLSSASTIDSILYNCYSLVTFPKIKFYKGSVWNLPQLTSTFGNCHSLVDFPSTEDFTFRGNFSSAFYGCYSLKKIGVLDMINTQYVDAVNDAFTYCISLETAYLKNVSCSIKLTSSSLLSKESLLYIINNEASTSAITITLASYAYNRLANDADIVAALANHPNISLAK